MNLKHLLLGASIALSPYTPRAEAVNLGEGIGVDIITEDFFQEKEEYQIPWRNIFYMGIGLGTGLALGHGMNLYTLRKNRRREENSESE